MMKETTKNEKRKKIYYSVCLLDVKAIINGQFAC